MAINSSVVAPYLKNVDLKFLTIAVTVFLVAFTGYLTAWLIGRLMKRPQEEIVACAGLMLKAAARQLKNGKIIDLGPLGKLYPSVSGKWVEKEEDLALTDLTPHCNYRPSQEVSEAIKGATIGWATAKDEGETEPTDDNTNSGNQGGDNNPSSGELEG